jgi:hypothetical protein
MSISRHGTVRTSSTSKSYGALSPTACAWMCGFVYQCVRIFTSLGVAGRSMMDSLAFVGLSYGPVLFPSSELNVPDTTKRAGKLTAFQCCREECRCALSPPRGTHKLWKRLRTTKDGWSGKRVGPPACPFFIPCLPSGERNILDPAEPLHFRSEPNLDFALMGAGGSETLWNPKDANI